MKKRLVCLLLVLSMLFSMLPVSILAAEETQPEEYVNPFTDVKEGDWFYDAVKYVCVNGIFNGTSDTTFEPNGYMTRAMFVTVLGRMAGVDKDSYAGISAFEDVAADAYYAPYVAWASKYGITQGTGDGKFSPDLAINRQQMATFFVRYFEAFDVVYDTGISLDTKPGDIDEVATWAKLAVITLWQSGLLNGDGVNIDPAALATRAQCATLCMRADQAVEVWYKEPGVPGRQPQPEEGEEGEEDEDGKLGLNYTVRFFDGDRLIDKLSTPAGEPLGRVPDVEKSSKPGAILVGYYKDPEFTEPFYAEEPLMQGLDVYAKYIELESNEVLYLDSFTRMDQDPDVSFRVQWVSGNVAPENAASLVCNSGYEPEQLAVSGPDAEGYYTIYAPGGFKPGNTYEMTLAEGWIFEGKDEAIRSVSFSILMDEVSNLRMSDDIIFIPGTQVSGGYTVNYGTGTAHYDILKADAMNIEGADMSSIFGYFTYTGSESVEEGDLICVYVGVHPNERIDLSNDDDPSNDIALTDPAVYVKVKSVEGSKITFVPMDEEDQLGLYEIPDLFPFYVDELPDAQAESLSININDLDLSMYETAMGSVDGTLENAVTKVSERDFIVLYTGLDEEENEIFYGRIVSFDVDSGIITYVPSSEEEMTSCMDLYSIVDIQGSSLVSEEQRAYLEQTLYAQVQESGFAEEAAYLLADLVSKTEGFTEALTLSDFVITDSEGNPLSDEEIALLNLGGSFELTDDVQLTVELITSGSQLHFRDGVQLAIGVDASFEVEVEDGVVAIDLSATFVQEASLKPSVRGELVYKEILGIKWPIGVQVNADIDIKSYTALSFAAEIYTVADEEASLWEQMQDVMNDPTAIAELIGVPEELMDGLSTVGDIFDRIEELESLINQGLDTAATIQGYAQEVASLWTVLEDNGLADREDWENFCSELGKTSVTSDLLGLADLSLETGRSAEYYEGLEALLQKYSETVQKETDWVKLLEEEIFTAEVCVCGICIGVEVNFVVRADMSIAIGSNLEYQVGKRYSFWFKIGLFTPSAGSEVTDLIDEHFAFQFYVMGRLGVKAGISAKLYVGIGSKSVANVGIRAELGPYVKLYGFFVYEYTKHRAANTDKWTYREQMAGALFVEFGLYFMLSFEAEALSLFEYSYDFLDEELPLLTAGDRRYYYDMNYEPAEDEIVVVRDENGDSTDGVTMALSDELRALSYVDLVTGRFGSEALDYSRYIFTVSNPAFSVSEDGIISVDVPGEVRYMECDLTITYRYGKLAFSQYDMSVTIPLIWTDLTIDELKEYYTASVRVGNDADGYDTVWTKKLLKRQPFDLPSINEIKTLIGWSDSRYSMAGGYGDQPLTELTIIEDTAYEFNIDYASYSLTVTGIQNPDGSTYSKTYYAKYGHTFDFSDLKSTGTNIVGSTYTKFIGVSTLATITVNGKEEIIDLSQPINAKIADALSKGVVATANYIDDSAKAIFTFSGLTAEDVIVTVRKGEVPSTAAIQKVVDESGRIDIAITGIEPALGPINCATNYNVNCVNLTGARNTVHLDLQGGQYLGSDTIESMDKLVGSLLVNLPEAPDVARVGYDFDGWFTESKGDALFTNPGENALTQIVPEPSEEDYTLYAQWTPHVFHVSFKLNGGQCLMVRESLDQTTAYMVNPEDEAAYDMTVVYDSTFGQAYKYLDGADNLSDMAASEFYGLLPIPFRSSQHGFAGWYCDFDKDGILFEEGELVTEDTLVQLDGDTVLYARWKTLAEIDKSVYSFSTKTVTYNGQQHQAVYSFAGGRGSYYYLDDPDTLHYVEFPTDGYEMLYMRQTSEQYTRRDEYPYIAGTYNAFFNRDRDNDFLAMSWRYDAVLKINKASSSLSGSIYVASQTDRTVVPAISNLGGVGDGPIQFSFTTGSSAPGTWINCGAGYELVPGTYYVWARRGEGMNYAASAPIGPLQITVGGAYKRYVYGLTISTPEGGYAGTDAIVSAKLSDGSYMTLDKDGYNDFEQGCVDTYYFNSHYPTIYDGKIDVYVRINDNDTSDWYWRPDWLRLDTFVWNIANGGYNQIKYGTAAEAKEDFDKDGEVQTYTMSGYGRNVNTDSYGLSLSGSYISINSTISDAYYSNYNPYAYDNAPKFVAYFGSRDVANDSQHSIFNAYITRVDLYTFYVDWDGLREAMDEYRISKLTLYYGIQYGSSKGAGGAGNYMQSKTVTIDLPY